MHRRRPGRGCHLREVLIHFHSLAESCNFGGGPFGPPPFSLMPESRFARLSASPHDNKKPPENLRAAFIHSPFRLTSGRPTILPRPAGENKCRAGADPTQHNKRQHRLGTCNATRGCFSSALFSTQPGVSFHATASAGRGKGLASSPAACGRPSRYRQPAKVIRIFHEKWKKEGWFVPVERQETLLHTGVKNGIIILRWWPGGRCVGALFIWTGFRELPLPKLPLFLFFGFIVTIFVENSKRENKNFVTFPVGRAVFPCRAAPGQRFFTGFLPGFLGVSGGFPAGTELTGKNRRATLRLVG